MGNSIGRMTGGRDDSFMDDRGDATREAVTNTFTNGLSNPVTTTMNVVGGLGNLGLGIWDRVEQQKVNEANKQIIEEQIDYQKQLNEEQMHREDTAYQRAINDLQQAGINKYMAVEAGQSNTGAYSATNFQDAGQQTTNKQRIADALNIFMTTAQNLSNLEQTQAQNRLIEEEILNRQSNRSLMDSQNFLNELLSAKTDEERKKIIQDRLNAELQYKIDLHDYQLNTRYDIRSNDALMQEFNTLKATIQEFMNDESMTRKIINPILNYFKETFKDDRDYNKYPLNNKDFNHLGGTGKDSNGNWNLYP